ncbi:MAG: hypothetical protein CL484_09450 [Acidobacteria bacterium]|nr:hypothetical protein [Acidobacteriota bacterium]
MTSCRQIAVGIGLVLLGPTVLTQATTCIASATEPSAAGSPVSAARALVSADLAERGYPGVSVAVSVHGETVWSEGFGYANLEHRVPMWPSTKFRVGSISKPMTAAAVAMLVEDGRLDLDLPVQYYVPSFPVKEYPITTRHLGGHLSGIRHYRGNENFIRDPYASVHDALSIFKDDQLLHEPGTAYSYTSFGFNLISAVIEGAAGQPFLDYLNDAVLDPIGMRDTTADFITKIIPQRTSYYMRDDAGNVVNAPFVNNSYKWAGGGLLSTTEDVLRFANAHLSDNFLSDAALDLLFTEQKTVEGKGVGYGFGWSIQSDDDGRLLLGHSGGSVGGTSLMLIQPDTRVVIVGLINMTGAKNRVLREVLQIFVEAVEASDRW